MELSEYVEYIKRYEIPPTTPSFTDDAGMNTEWWNARHELNIRGCWTMIALDWVKPLADWIGDRKVLEVMAGGGWLAKALIQHGVEIIATDDLSWQTGEDSPIHSRVQPLVPIIPMEASRAAEEIDADILLVSWPPYGDEAILRTLDVWGIERPVIYIGEGNGGCNAPEEFFDYFLTDHKAPHIQMPSFWGLHDGVSIGSWTR